MTCLDGLQSAQDMARILETCAGPDWPAQALYGLVALVVILALVGVAFVAAIAGRRG